MVKPISQPRSYEGYGSGAATPDSTRLPARVPKSTSRNVSAPQQSRPQGWKPTVSRQRPDLPQNPKPTAERVAKPQQAPAPKPSGVKKPRVSAKAAAAAGRSATAGVRQRVLPAPGTTPNPEAPKGPAAAKPVTRGAKFRGLGLKALNIAIASGTIVTGLFAAKETAESMWESDPSLQIKYASKEDLEKDLQGSAVVQGVGAMADEIAMFGAQRAAAWMLTPLIGAGPAGWAAMVIGFIVLPVILDEVTKGQPNTNVGEGILQDAKEFEGVEGKVALDALGVVSKFGLARYTSVYGMNFGDAFYRNTPITDLVRTFGWDNAKYRTPEQKQQLRLEMGPQQWNYDGKPYVTYKTFGPRTEEVKAVLAQGFFLNPLNGQREVIHNGKKQMVREFYFDYEAFTDWFEKSMWIAGTSNDKETVLAQTKMLPPLNEKITSVLTPNTPLTDAERRTLFLDVYAEIEEYAKQVKE